MITKENKYELIKFEDGEFELDVNVSPSEDTVWLSSSDMSNLFQRDETTIRKHINQIFASSEIIITNNNTQKMRVVGVKQLVSFYSLDVVLAVGYRVNSKRGILFRRWATQTLKQYLLKGHAINESRCLNCEDNILSLQANVKELQNKLFSLENKVLPLNDKDYFRDKLIMNNDIYEASSFLKSLLNKAKTRLIIIDSYVNNETLDLLVDIVLPITIYTLPSASITSREITNFNLNHHLTIFKTSNVHDRFLIIDNDLYAVGASLKDAGKKLTTIHKLSDISIDSIINNL